MNGFMTDHAPLSAEVDACIHCGLCLPFCPTFRLTGEERYSPRGRLAAMSAVIAGVTQLDDSFDDALSTCLGCRACEAVCPGLVPYGRAYEGAMAELTAQRPDTGRRVRGVVLGRLLSSRRLIHVGTFLAQMAQRLELGRVLPAAVARALRGLRPLARRPASWVGRTVGPVGTERGTVALLAGCVMDAWFGDVHSASVGVLTRAGFRVTIPESQVCCGALAAHDGHVAAAKRLAAVNVDVFESADLVVADAAGCSAHMAEYGQWAQRGDAVAGKVRDITVLVAELIADGSLPQMPPIDVRVAIQDPCHLRHAQRQFDPARTVVAASGMQPVEIDPDGLCCGAAGIYSLLHPETSAELGRKKAAQVAAAGVEIVASANPGCEMQLRSHLAATYRVAHPVELYWQALAGRTIGARYSQDSD